MSASGAFSGYFHLLQASARAERRAIPQQGGSPEPGYDGHAFLGTPKVFVLPVLTYTAPHAVADALRSTTAQNSSEITPTRVTGQSSLASNLKIWETRPSTAAVDRDC